VADMSKSKFGVGVFTGVLATIGTIAAGALAVKKNVIDPVNEKEQRIEDNRKKAARKRIAR
jgi:hypothetical protein